MAVPPTSAPRLAIVIPVFGHSILVTEALHTALGQKVNFGIHIVMVNDGCPQAETDLVLSTIALAHPDRVTYLRKPNGGLSSARNAGIAQVLAHLPSVEAVFMLDADNRLRPNAMARAMAALDAHPKAGWIYPSIDMFGIPARCDYGGPYSQLIHSEMNISEAGSLIRRAVFEQGVLFDESFTQGFEDWHFFLTAGEAGFFGVNLEDFGFLYRKRPESMLADADRSRDLLVERVREAHPALYDPSKRLSLEHEEAPRYAIWLSDRDEILLVTDPARPGPVLSRADYARAWWCSRTSPMQCRVPPFLVVASKALLEALESAKLLHWALWRLEVAAGEGDMACAVIRSPASAGVVASAPIPDFRINSVAVRNAQAVLWLVGAEPLAALLSDPDLPDFETAQLPCAGLSLRLELPTLSSAPGAGELGDVLACLHGSCWYEAGQHRWRWRQPSIGWRGKEHHILRKALNGQPILPRLWGDTRKIGLITDRTGTPSLLKALRHLQSARAAGAELHLYIMSDSADLDAIGYGGQVDGIALLDAAIFTLSDGAGPGNPLMFNGTFLPRPTQQVLDDKAMSLMFGLDELHNLGCSGALRLMGGLRRFGINTVLHLLDTSHPALSTEITLALAYEHAHDRIVASTESMAAYLRARGVPRVKVTTQI